MCVFTNWLLTHLWYEFNAQKSAIGVILHEEFNGVVEYVLWQLIRKIDKSYGGFKAMLAYLYPTTLQMPDKLPVTSDYHNYCT